MRRKLENKWIKKNKYPWERTEVRGRRRSQESREHGVRGERKMNKDLGKKQQA